MVKTTGPLLCSLPTVAATPRLGFTKWGALPGVGAGASPAHVLDPEPRQRDATAAAFRTAARPRVAVAMRELEAAVETRRRLDDENLALVFERSLQVFEVLRRRRVPECRRASTSHGL